MNQNLPTAEEVYSTYDKDNNLKKKYKIQCLTSQKNHKTLDYSDEIINNKHIGIIQKNNITNTITSITIPPDDTFNDTETVFSYLMGALFNMKTVMNLKNDGKIFPIITNNNRSGNIVSGYNLIQSYIDDDGYEDTSTALVGVSLKDLIAPPNMEELKRAIDKWNNIAIKAGIGAYDKDADSLNFTPSDSVLSPIQLMALGSLTEDLKIYDLNTFYKDITNLDIPQQKSGFKRWAFPITITFKQKSSFSMVVDSVTIKSNNTVTVLDPPRPVPEGVYYYHNTLASNTISLDYLVVRLLSNEIEAEWKNYLTRMDNNNKILKKIKLDQNTITIINRAEYRKALYDLATAILNDTATDMDTFDQKKLNNDSGAFGIIPFNPSLKQQPQPLDTEESYSKKINTLKISTLKQAAINLQNLVDIVHQHGPLINTAYTDSDFDYKENNECDKCYTYSIHNISSNSFNFFTTENGGKTLGTYYCPSQLGDDVFTTEKHVISKLAQPKSIYPPFFSNNLGISDFFDISSISIGARSKFMMNFDEDAPFVNYYLLNTVSTPADITSTIKDQIIIPILTPSQMIHFSNTMNAKCGLFIFEYLYKTLKIDRQNKQSDLSKIISTELDKLEKIIEKLKPETGITSELCAPIITEYRNKLNSFIELYSTIYPEGTGRDTSPWYELAKYTIKPHDGTLFKDAKGKLMVHLEINKIPINKPYVG